MFFLLWNFSVSNVANICSTVKTFKKRALLLESQLSWPLVSLAYFNVLPTILPPPFPPSFPLYSRLPYYPSFKAFTLLLSFSLIFFCSLSLSLSLSQYLFSPSLFIIILLSFSFFFPHIWSLRHLLPGFFSLYSNSFCLFCICQIFSLSCCLSKMTVVKIFIKYISDKIICVQGKLFYILEIKDKFFLWLYFLFKTFKLIWNDLCLLAENIHQKLHKSIFKSFRENNNSLKSPRHHNITQSYRRQSNLCFMVMGIFMQIIMYLA